MDKKVLMDSLGWGFILWLVGYVLGIILFTLVKPGLIGWFILPIGILIALFVLIKKIKSTSIKYYLILSISWTLIALVLDYFFLVKTFKPADGYYKLDVYLYYGLTFALPFIVGWSKNKSAKS